MPPEASAKAGASSSVRRLPRISRLASASRPRRSPGGRKGSAAQPPWQRSAALQRSLGAAAGAAAAASVAAPLAPAEAPKWLSAFRWLTHGQGAMLMVDAAAVPKQITTYAKNLAAGLFQLTKFEAKRPLTRSLLG